MSATLGVSEAAAFSHELPVFLAELRDFLMEHGHQASGAGARVTQRVDGRDPRAHPTVPAVPTEADAIAGLELHDVVADRIHDARDLMARHARIFSL